MNSIIISDRIINLNCCVLIPTYNNERTLNRVIDGVLKYTEHIIIINDGATDSTSEILKSYPNLEQIHFPKNKGKGVALREGFKKAHELGYAYAITIDSDGQHYPEDIAVFITAIEKSPNSLLIGDRNMDQEGIPKKSSFGNNFSNFWYTFETGVKLTDTQSGYRLYPLEKLADLNYYTTKFEFEIEVIVRASWKGITVKNVPIQVLYDESERVTHFRPIKDFTRISILNTVLVLIALLYIKPRDLFRKLKKKGLKRFFLEDFLQNSDSKEKKALSIGLGVFIGISPLWGFQTALVIFL
ncbi:MAG: glycosyltransferase, partial [Flavobacteriaceae bacterium]|nr:glycosyltransferase [Flavobacteriaceae bacterium]